MSKSYVCSSISDKDVMELAWKYFEHHGNQRLTHINFFTLLSSGLLISQFTILSTQNSWSYTPIILGIIQGIVSFVFYKIDERTMFLVKHAEKVLISIESKYDFIQNNKYIDSLKIFTNEVDATLEDKDKKMFLKKQISHRISYRILLASFALTSLIGSIWGVINIMYIVNG